MVGLSQSIKTGAINLKRLLLVILSISFLGCFSTIKKDSNVVSAPSEKNDDNYSDEFKETDKPPNELKLSLLLYGLAVNPEPEKYAKKHGIFLTKGKVRVFISFNPASSKLDRDSLAAHYNFIVEKKTNDLSRVLVPIDRLIPLSKESNVWSLRLPDRAIKP